MPPPQIFVTDRPGGVRPEPAAKMLITAFVPFVIIIKVNMRGITPSKRLAVIPNGILADRLCPKESFRNAETALCQSGCCAFPTRWCKVAMAGWRRRI